MAISVFLGGPLVLLKQTWLEEWEVQGPHSFPYLTRATGLQGSFSVVFVFLRFYLFMRDRERRTQAEGEAGSLRGT